MDLAPVPNDSVHKAEMRNTETIVNVVRAIGNNGESLLLSLGLILGGTVFGGLHCLAWDFHFPTPYESTIWKVCAVLTSVLPLLSIVPACLWMRLNPWGNASRAPRAVRVTIGASIVLIFLVLYVLARLFLMVECFRSLLFFPTEALIDTWSGSLLHWG